MADFNAVLQIDPENKPARQQVIIASNKLHEQHQQEKQMYASIFDKLAKIDQQQVNRLALSPFMKLFAVCY